jgi:putative DNA primase/helicase
MTTSSASRELRSALSYASLGWRVLPLHTPDAAGACSCRRRDCPKPGKHPRTRREGDVVIGGVHDASSSSEVVSSWWRMWPDANVGLATGELIVIDVDGALGEASLQRLQDEHGALPGTLEATSGRGRHLYFSDPSEQLGNSVGRLGGGLDVRGSGGYIVAPPSLHADGHRYRWRTRRRPAALPLWVAELLTEPPARAARTVPPPPAAAGDRRRRYFTAALRTELAEVASAQPGTRNDTLNRAAFRLAQLAVDGAGTLDELEHYLLDAALAAGLDELEARATIASGLRAGQQHPRR